MKDSPAPTSVPQVELWDLYDRHRNPLGRTIRRDPNGHTQIPAGTYHLVVECVIVDKSERILFTQRAPHVKHHPGYWECTTGSVMAGEDSITGVRREVLEETGLDFPSDKFILLKTIVTDIVIRDIYMVLLDKINLNEVHGEECEISAATTLSFDSMFLDRTSCCAPDGKQMMFRWAQIARIQSIMGMIRENVDKANGKTYKRQPRKAKAADYEACDPSDMSDTGKPAVRRGRPKKKPEFELEEVVF